MKTPFADDPSQGVGYRRVGFSLPSSPSPGRLKPTLQDRSSTQDQSSTRPRRPRRQVARQRRVELLIGPEGDVVDVDHLAALLDLVQIVADLGLVGPTQGV